MKHAWFSLKCRSAGVLLASLCLLTATAPAAVAELQGGSQRFPGWKVASHALPTQLTPGVGPGGRDFIQLEVFDVGAGASEGPVRVTDTLPTGIRYTGAAPHRIGEQEVEAEPWTCAGAGIVTCTSTEPVAGSKPRLIDLEVAVEPGVSGSLANTVIASEGGAHFAASNTSQVQVGPTRTNFGFNGFEAWATNPDGTLDTQAGSHPYELTVSYNLNTVRQPGHAGDETRPAGSETERVIVNLPPGLIGDPQAVAQCPRERFDTGLCPPATQVGVDYAVLGEFAQLAFQVFNLVPPPGRPAQFGFVLINVKTFLTASVRSGGDYGITSTTNDIAQRDITSNQTVIWGVPSDPSHDKDRCTAAETSGCPGVPGDGRETPFLTLPTSCQAPPQFSIETTGWLGDAFSATSSAFYEDGSGHATSLTGCTHLNASPSLALAPDTAQADTPAGLTADVKVPQEGLVAQEGLSAGDIKNTVVTLPAGLVINPGQAAGLQACPASLDGLTSAAEKAEGLENGGPPQCPLASKVGTVAIATPLLPDKLEGDIYVLQSNPPNLQLLVAASADGVNVKLVGNVHLDEATGQLVTTFSNTPQLPFTDFKLSFTGGAQAALATPTACGTYTTTSDFGFWSSPFTVDALAESTFSIVSGPGGSPCSSSPMPFAPSMTAGSTTDRAGAFTNFSLLLQRGDGQQRIEKLQFKEPAGLAGLISSVPLCPEPQAAQGTCSAASHIGHAVVASGPGPYPLVLPQPGAPELPIYLTGPYKGAPFGLSIVTPVIAGPFNLGTIITRASIAVDPSTAQITITTDPLPQVVAGVPTDLRQIQSVIDRPNFLFNPTNCMPQEFTGTAWGTPPPGAGGPGATAAVSSHFGVGSCRELAFTPKIGVTTAAKSSKANGASLFFDIAYPKGALGKQSWFNEAKFDLPKQLPARLTTLQKACLASVFETNPAACPPGSLIGHAVVHTQVLPVPLSGPVYFVSHGGAKFPDAVLVLQGDGVRINLVGETFISKAGVTSATFRNTPDVPFENIEVTIPSGPFSEFGANLPASAHGSFCGQKLVMPTFFKAQNGLEIHQSTKLNVSGCPKARKATRAQKLRAALKACHKKHAGKRASCEKAARKAFGTRSSRHASTKK